MLPRVWSSLLRVKMAALGTFVSCSLVIFFSPSKRMNDSKVGGAFITESLEEGGGLPK